MKRDFENMIYEKLKKRRTIRKFLQKNVPKEVLLRCVDAARLSPNGANRQPLKYIIVKDTQKLKLVFKTLSWAGYLPNYQPCNEEMPKAYIVLLLDKDISEKPRHDVGIAAMSITMVAYDEGISSCMLGAIDRKKIRKILKIPDKLDIILVVALGYPAENPVVDNIKKGDIKYWLDKKGVLHVPKRKLEDILFWNGYQSD
jgi:nitroreductase